VFKSTNGALKTINSSRLTVDVEGNLWFSNVTRNDMSDEFLYACSAASYFRNEYKLGNRVFLQVKLRAERKKNKDDFKFGGLVEE
jgi:neuronal cell adhesion protein